MVFLGLARVFGKPGVVPCKDMARPVPRRYCCCDVSS